MHRHVIAPTRFYSQLPNDIIRHPRLSANAVRLLAWQLSLPEGSDEPLWKTAERAGIGKIAFQRAKSQLRAECYLYEWRCQGEGGRWTTVQLVANVPLSPEEAHAARYPAAVTPAAGAPTGREPAPQPRRTPEENTSHPDVGHEAEAEAEALLLSLGRAAPHLAMPVAKARRWAPLVAPWLALGLPAAELRRTLVSGLERARSPLGALRWRLEHALPAVPDGAAGPPPPEPRVAAMRECAGPHTQPLLFTPVGDEEQCPGCRTARAESASDRGSGAGLAAFRAARGARKVPVTTSP
ncbi:hypothetical protein [Streptomyces daliensis]|uniref:Uncharacterized protein n=1 Tax=Streptomyces daliensis TaxID=299421 RepID=A0A8T4IVV3_9ACTN|nr:hypothetical protein [Streptomyces daliensis]